MPLYFAIRPEKRALHWVREEDGDWESAIIAILQKRRTKLASQLPHFADGQISDPAFIFRVLDCCTIGHSAQKAFWEMCPALVWGFCVPHPAGYYPQCQSLCIPAPRLVWTFLWFPILMSSSFFLFALFLIDEGSRKVVDVPLFLFTFAQITARHATTGKHAHTWYNL